MDDEYCEGTYYKSDKDYLRELEEDYEEGYEEECEEDYDVRDHDSVDYDGMEGLSENDIYDAHDDPRSSARIRCCKDLDRSVAIAETLFRSLHYSHENLKIVTEVRENGVAILTEGVGPHRGKMNCELDTFTFEAICDYAAKAGIALP